MEEKRYFAPEYEKKEEQSFFGKLRTKKSPTHDSYNDCQSGKKIKNEPCEPCQRAIGKYMTRRNEKKKEYERAIDKKHRTKNKTPSFTGFYKIPKTIKTIFFSLKNLDQPKRLSGNGNEKGKNSYEEWKNERGKKCHKNQELRNWETLCASSSGTSRCTPCRTPGKIFRVAFGMSCAIMRPSASGVILSRSPQRISVGA